MKRIISETIQEVDISMTNLKFLKDSLALKFQEVSKYDKFSFLQERDRITRFSSPVVVERVIKPYKTYPSKREFQLSFYGIDIEGDVLFKTITQRRSRRDFVDYSISANELYKILHCSYGITGGSKVRGGEGIWHYRAVPSGGGLYPLELYVYANKSVLEQGLYHFRPDQDSIEYISNSVNLNSIVPNIAADNINITDCSCLMFITSVFQRNMLKYGERGYRFLLQEVGAVLQNISLICEHLDLSSCILGGYVDDAINEILGVNSPLETIQGIIVIGKGK